MSEAINTSKTIKKPGPAPKINKMRCKISVWCTAEDKATIKARAATAGLPASEFLRRKGLRSQVRTHTLSPQVLAFSGQLHQLCGALYSIARMRDNKDDLDITLKIRLEYLAVQARELIHNIQKAST